jgi:hypothetical protein
LKGSNFGKNYLVPNCKIVHSNDFENAICKIYDGAEKELSDMQKSLVKNFEIASKEIFANTDVDVQLQDCPVALQVIKKRRTSLRASAYQNVAWIPITSNEVERFFSLCKMVYSDYRKRLHPVNQEMQVF